ncbi:MAG: sulfatase-like hydrolase/transferase, partial [Nanoarchaeota archaeon]
VYYFIPKESDTFTKIFSLRGYRTILVNANDISYTNIFKDFQEKTMLGTEVDDLGVADNVMIAINKSKNDKFFLWAHFLSPHVPYLPPYPYNNSFYQDEYYNKLNVIYKSLINGLAYLNTQEFDFYVSQYDGEILSVDNQIQRIINFLEKEKLLDNTLVIISADHGESFGENNNIYFGHGSLYDTNIRIPLIIYNPKTNIHGRIYNQIQGIDLFPTLFNIVGIRNFFESDGKSFHGIITENKTSGNNIAFSLVPNTTFSLRTNKWKYIHHYSGETGELYNLKEDPQEIINLINNSNKLKDLMEPELVEKIEELRSK